MKNRYTPFVIAIVVFAIGLALGAGKSGDDTSTANTLSKVFLTIGLLGLIAAIIITVLRHRRSRTAAH